MQGVVTTPRAPPPAWASRPQDKVAVKTGTAQAGHTVTTTVDWMIGFAPATTRRVAMAVVVPEQASTHYGADHRRTHHACG